MVRLQPFLPYLAVSFAASAYAAIGPVANLVISNADVTPDGFTRAAVVVNGAFPFIPHYRLQGQFHKHTFRAKFLH